MDASSDIAMPLDSNASVDGRAVAAEFAKPRRGLTQYLNSAPSALLRRSQTAVMREER